MKLPQNVVRSLTAASDSAASPFSAGAMRETPTRASETGGSKPAPRPQPTPYPSDPCPPCGKG